MSGIDRRGELVAWIGLGWSAIAAILLGILAIWSLSTSAAVWAVAFQQLGAAGIWFLTLILLHQRRMVAEERLEIAELERQRQEKLGGAQTIFNEEDLDQMDRLSMGRRLRSIERILVPVVALLITAFHALAGISILPWIWQFPPIADAGTGPIIHAMVLAVCCGGIAFVNFMLARYALGMSRLEDWHGLCAGGNFSFGSSIVCLAVATGLLCADYGYAGVELWVGRGVGFLLFLLACETIINFVLDLYRPRVPGLRQRPFYDSRLLGMFSEPGGILRSMANAIDYQFGFKVSETWFYKLLGRAVVPLLLVQIAVIFALTCIVVVPPGHQAVIEHWGKLRSETAKSGIHLTMPWPIDRASVIPVDRIRRMELGHAPEEEKARKQAQAVRRPILWSKAHYKKEYQLLVADRVASEDTEVPANLLSVAMPVQWKVKADDRQVIRFHAQSRDVGAIIESLAYSELTRYAAQADILDLLGAGGVQAAADLHRNIQEACDAAGMAGQGLGVEIVYVGIGGIHPPPDDEVASTYEAVVSALEKRDASIKAAEGAASGIRVKSAGIAWQKLYDVIVQEDEARRASSVDLPRLSKEVEQLLRSASGGETRALVAEAQRDAVSRVFGEQSAAERYAMQVAAYDAAPNTYLLRVYLKMLEDGLKKVRKYIVVLDDQDRVIYELDLKPPAIIDTLAAEAKAMDREAELPR